MNKLSQGLLLVVVVIVSGSLTWVLVPYKSPYNNSSYNQGFQDGRHASHNYCKQCENDTLHMRVCSECVKRDAMYGPYGLWGPGLDTYFDNEIGRRNK